MSALTDALARRPEGLNDKHTQLARLLLGNPEGMTRRLGANRLGISDRVFRQLVEDVVSSGWLPIVADRGTHGTSEARYRIARADEVDRVNQEALEQHSRAMSLHKRSRGLTAAFRAHHTAGSLFVQDVPDLEEAI